MINYHWEMFTLLPKLEFLLAVELITIHMFSSSICAFCRLFARFWIPWSMGEEWLLAKNIKRKEAPHRVQPVYVWGDCRYISCHSCPKPFFLRTYTGNCILKYCITSELPCNWYDPLKQRERFVSSWELGPRLPHQWASSKLPKKRLWSSTISIST